MGKFIEKLRELNGWDSSEHNYEYNELIQDELMDAWDTEGYTVEQVHEEFEDGGRWTNYRTRVYKVTEYDNNGEIDEVAYFSVWQEEPATEMQWGGDFSLTFSEVKPVEKTVIVYE